MAFDFNVGGWTLEVLHTSETRKKALIRLTFHPYGNPRLEDGPEGEHLTERLANDACILY